MTSLSTSLFSFSFGFSLKKYFFFFNVMHAKFKRRITFSSNSKEKMVEKVISCLEKVLWKKLTQFKNHMNNIYVCPLKFPFSSIFLHCKINHQLSFLINKSYWKGCNTKMIYQYNERHSFKLIMPCLKLISIFSSKTDIFFIVLLKCQTYGFF